MRCDEPPIEDVLVLQHEATRRIAVLCKTCIKALAVQGADALLCYGVPDRPLN
jgi:hypothetical protein